MEASNVRPNLNVFRFDYHFRRRLFTDSSLTFYFRLHFAIKYYLWEIRHFPPKMTSHIGQGGQ